MRGLAVLTVLLVLAALLAGCSDAPKQAGDKPAATDGGDRIARGGRGGDGGEGETDLRSVEILHTPFQSSGPASQSFDVQVPADVDSVEFSFTGGQTFQGVGLRVELSGCGGYDGSMGASGSTPGEFRSDLCGAAEAGPQTVAISGNLIVFDGQFIVTAYVPANATA